MNFTHLHLQTEYSLLNGECRIPEVVEHAKEMGFKSLAITDRNALFGAVEFYKECSKHGIKAIIGCECTVSPRSRFDRSRLKDSDCSRIVLLVKNEKGYKNLIKIVSLSYTDGLSGHPRIDTELLEKYNDGIIALSGGIQGVIANDLLRREPAAAEKNARLYKKIFPGSFYIEIQRHNTQDEKAIEQRLLEIAEKNDIPVVATNGVHYTKQENAAVQQILVLLANGATVKSSDKYGLPNDSYYLKSRDEMYRLFNDIPKALENTEEIANQIAFEFDFSAMHLPAFYIDGSSNMQYLRTRCYEGLKTRKNRDDFIALNIYNKRIEYELEIIEKTGFVDYYLIVDDFVRYAKKKHIPVGPGRGSGVGSLVAYCIGITDVDPIKNGLLFERFLNPERVSMPDFDIDFCYDRRGEVIDYVANKYGADHVAQIITFGTLACRAAVRDAARALGLSYPEIDNIAKLVGHASSIMQAISENKALSAAMENDDNIKRVIRLAEKLEGRPRHCSTHATGVVITDKPVNEYVPVSLNGDVAVTQFTMNTVAELGLLKIDFLGLRYLTIIRNAEREVQRHNPEFDISRIPLDDGKTYELLSSANTAGVFQLESAGMKNLLRQLRPENISDITLSISLYRPGPMESIQKCLDNRKNPNNIHYKIPLLKDVLKDTFGCIIYQEQVMQICRTVAGFTYGHADIIRRAMAKKKKSEMEREREAFIAGAADNNIGNAEAAELFDEMSTFASYAFNKSHAAAYAVISYRTAYLKANYPKEYLCALMSTVAGENVKLGEYIDDAARMGIKICGPDINLSRESFSVEESSIRFGLLAVKNIGLNQVNNIIAERNNGLFTSVEDFLQRVYKFANIRMIESLVQCGAFDSFGVYRSRLFAALPAAMEKLQLLNRSYDDAQLDLFGAGLEDSKPNIIEYPTIPEYTLEDKLAFEKQLTGAYLSGHPLNEYTDCYKNGAISVLNYISGANDGSIPNGMLVTLLCIVAGVRNKTTKNNDVMAFLLVEDSVAECEVTVFPKLYTKTMSLLEEGNVLLVSGTADITPSDNARTQASVKLVAQNICNAIKNIPSVAEDIYLRVTDENERYLNACIDEARKTVGNSRLLVYFQSTGRRVRVKDVRCELSDMLLTKLERYMGKENVKTREQKND